MTCYLLGHDTTPKPSLDTFLIIQKVAKIKCQTQCSPVVSLLFYALARESDDAQTPVRLR